MASIFLRRPPMQAVGPRLQPGMAAPSMADWPDAMQQSAAQVVAFLRHVGCPFAEHTVKRLRAWAEAHPRVAVAIVAHGDAAITQAWLDTIGGLGRLQLLHDPERRLYGQWGLGYASLWHFANPMSLLGVAALWRQGVRNRSATGTRWQQAAIFLVQQGRVAWLHVPTSAQEFALPPEALLAAELRP